MRGDSLKRVHFDGTVGMKGIADSEEDSIPTSPLLNSFASLSQLPRMQSQPVDPAKLLRMRTLSRSSSSDGMKMTIVLGLEGTLVSGSTTDGNFFDFDVGLDCDGKRRRTFVQKRPFLDRFLTALSARANLILMTASVREYTEQVLAYLDPFSKIFKSFICRDDCVAKPEGGFLKDPSVLHLENPIIVDDDKTSIAGSPEGLITVKRFTGESNDLELMKVLQEINGFLDPQMI